jgi:hypothetical protein
VEVGGGMGREGEWVRGGGDVGMGSVVGHRGYVGGMGKEFRT